MQVIDTQTRLAAVLEDLREKGKSVGLVPTMGALHEGHASLVKVSLKENDVTVVSVFVNPTQFNDPKDFNTYPRTVSADIDFLEKLGADIVFTPSVEDIHPNPPFTAVQKVAVNWMSTHSSNYKMLTAHPEWMAGIKAMERSITGKSYRYIPKNKIANNQLFRSAIHDGDIIVIITNKKGLDTTHIGLASWHADGLHLLNASSIHHRVIDEPMLLRTYMSKHPVQTGIRVCRVTDR